MLRWTSPRTFVAWLLAVAMMAALAVEPSGASASYVRVVSDVSSGHPRPPSYTLVYSAARGEPNRLVVSLSEGAYTFRDDGAAITAGEGCARVSDQEATCRPPAERFFGTDVQTGDLDDSIRMPEVVGVHRMSADGGEGADVIEGGPQMEALSGGPGPDRVNGGGGNDDVSGGPGDDDVRGGAGSDSVSGGLEQVPFRPEPRPPGGGQDTLSGDSGNDTLDDDDFIGGPRNLPTPTVDNRGPDAYDGGEGFDHVEYGSRRSPVTVNLADPGTDGEPGEGDELRGIEAVGGGASDDTLTGDEQRNRLVGGMGSDTLSGAGGDDELVDNESEVGGPGRPGADTTDGGEGTDTWDLSSRASGLHVDLRQPGPAGAPGEGDTATGIENVIGGRGDDVLLGGADDNVLDGGYGKDRLDGGDGSDVVRGSGDSDVVSGGQGADVLTAGEDYHGRDEDTIDYSARATGVVVTPGEVDDDGQAGENDRVSHGFETILGGSGDDHLVGDAGANEVEGGAGNDVLDGREGDDLLDGGPGADAMTGGSDRRGGDIDTVDYSARTEALLITFHGSVHVRDPEREGVYDGAPGEGDQLRDGVERLLTGSGNDRVFGTNAGEFVVAGRGNDRVEGYGGDDVLDGASGNDRLSGGSGNDRLLGDSGRDLLATGAGSNTVLAGAGNDTVEALNRRRDLVRCEAGRDAARADQLDRLSRCERVTRRRRSPRG